MAGLVGEQGTVEFHDCVEGDGVGGGERVGRPSHQGHVAGHEFGLAGERAHFFVCRQFCECHMPRGRRNSLDPR